MKQKPLTPEQSIRAAIIFLNLFGLRLQYGEKINKDNVLSILNSQNEEVGILTFDNDKILISTMSSFGKIDATYNISMYDVINDVECNNELFANWCNDIFFSITNNSTKFKGNFKLNCSMDQRFGLNCRPHFVIEYQKNKNNYFMLKLQHDGSFFRIETKQNKIYEFIDIRPFDDLNGYIVHDIKEGDNINYAGYPNRIYSCIRKAGRDMPNNIRSFKQKSHYSDIEYESVEYYETVGKDNLTEAVIQKGELMQKIDSDMFEKIAKLREYFKKDDCSLLDNLISICYTSHSDTEIKACLGIERNNIEYQNSADSLIDAYFGIGEDTKFLPPDVHKTLLKKSPTSSI